MKTTLKNCVCEYYNPQWWHCQVIKSIVTKQLEMQAYVNHMLKSKQENWYDPIDQTLKFLHSFMQTG
jgi:hypothetical protein